MEWQARDDESEGGWDENGTWRIRRWFGGRIMRGRGRTGRPRREQSTIHLQYESY